MKTAKNKEARKRLRDAFIADVKRQIRQNKLLFAVYLILRAVVIGVMIAQAFNRNWNDVFLCVLTLVLFMIPSFVEHRIKIDVPDTMEIIILLFIFSAEILGEIRAYYLTFPYWDAILHTINGFLCAAIGLSLINILNKSPRFAISLSPVFVAMVSFCFSMTVGVLWEFFEFGMDVIFHTDMQKDTIIPAVSSVLFHPEGKNIAVLQNIDQIIVNGTEWNYGGYIDIGLIDTMMDLFVNFVGAAVFSFIGMFYVKDDKKGKIAERFILTAKYHVKVNGDNKGEVIGEENVEAEEAAHSLSISSDEGP
jgi:hypothetical protein